MNVKLFHYVFLGAVLMSGCSSDEGILPSSGGSTSGEASMTKVVKTSGVQKLPLTVTRGTTEVSVEYTSGGQKKTFALPFTETSRAENSAMVSGFATIYSETPAEINVYNQQKLVAENVLLTGRQMTTQSSNVSSASASTAQNAYFFIRVDQNIPDYQADSPKNYYPQNRGGGSAFLEINRGKIETDVAKFGIPELQWSYPQKGSVTQYIYSSNGSATAPVILEEPDITKIKIKGEVIDTTQYKVIWYVVKLQNDGIWHVDGFLTKKSTTSVDGNGEEGEDDDIVIPTIPEKPDTPDVDKTSDGIYHDAGVMLYDQDGDKDYNDLVVDYDVEARFPKDGNFPYIKIVMHLRALSTKQLDKVSMDLKDLDKYVCPADDMNITFQGISTNETPNVSNPDDYHYDIPDFTDCGLVPSVEGQLSASVSNLQWLLTNGHEWYQLDGNGYYNVTQESFNGKPFATLSIMLYPKTDMTEEDVEQMVANILDTARKSFSFDGQEGDYIIAPVGTPHVAEGYVFSEAFPNYPKDGWWINDENQTNFDETKVVDINKGYKKAE